MNKTTTVLMCIVAGAVAGFLASRDWSGTTNGTDSSSIFKRSESVTPASFETLQVPVDFRAAAKRILPSVVSIDTTVIGRDFFGQTVETSGGEGSGVILSKDGYIVTNNHVISAGRRRAANKVNVHLGDGRVFPATIVGRDARTDLAVLKIQANGLQAAQIGTSGSLEVGEWVIAAGNPLGYENTLSVGVVSSLHRTLQAPGSMLLDAIQTDAAINPGNSGGALANSQGQLVGINTAIASTSGGSVGLGFAIPVDRVKRIVDEIIDKGYASHGGLGVLVFDRPGILAIPENRQYIAEQVGSEPPAEGLLVQEVSSQTAQQAGIGQFSVITAIGGKKMESSMDLAVALADKRPGEVVQVTFWSKGQKKTVPIRLEDIKGEL